jgi:glutaredoxin
MARIEIFTAPQCPHSKALKEFLDSIGVDYDEHNVLDSDNEFEKVKEISGQMAVPLTVIENAHFIGFDRRAQRRIKRQLGV